MNVSRFSHWAGALALAAGLMAGGSGSATAQTDPQAPAEPTAVLYNQTSNPGNFVDSSDWGSHFSSLRSQAADDFVVPTTAIWKITTVTASGAYVGSTGVGVLSLLVQIYTDGGTGRPDTLLYNQTVASGSIGGLATGVYVIALASTLTLGPGHYWFSAQAGENCTTQDGSNCKHWVWTERSLQANSESVWQNPPGGYGPNCPTWHPRVSFCDQPNGSSSPDLLFKLEGSSIPVVARIFLPVIRR